MLNLIIDIVFSLIIILLIINSIRLELKKRQYALTIAQLTLDKSAILGKLNKVLSETKLEKDENFVKFLSTTRDSAFEYISEVQNELNKFDTEMMNIKKYHETFGEASSDTVYHEIVTKIFEIYNPIKGLLPSEEIPNN